MVVRIQKVVPFSLAQCGAVAARHTGCQAAAVQGRGSPGQAAAANMEGQQHPPVPHPCMQPKVEGQHQQPRAKQQPQQHPLAHTFAYVQGRGRSSSSPAKRSSSAVSSTHLRSTSASPRVRRVQPAGVSGGTSWRRTCMREATGGGGAQLWADRRAGVETRCKEREHR